MAKKKKTRHQKMLADLRHKISLSEISQPTPAYTIAAPVTAVQKTVIKPSTAFANTNPYLLQDIRKTGLLTLSLLAAQFLLFILLQYHVVKIPGISY